MDKAFLEEQLQDYLAYFNIRGIQVAVVDHGETYTLSAGVRNQTGDPVEVNTIYPIGSTTKAFTAAAAGICVDRGLMNWDDPVRKYLPWFSMMDEYAGNHLTIRDALLNRSGMPRHEFSWMGSPFSRVEILQRYRFLPPRYEFRAEFRYTNQMYLLVGEVIAAITGIPFPQFLAQEIFTPLEMNRTTCSVNELGGLGNFATPYISTPNGAIDLPCLNIDNIGGAGCINSTSSNLVNWLKMLLSGGSFKGNQIISERSLREITSPQIIAVSQFLNTPDFTYRSYGMGWYVERYRGVKLVRHTGGINGFFSQAAIAPEKDLGIFVMVNTAGEDVCTPLLFSILDHGVGWENRDWLGYHRSIQSAFSQGLAARSQRLLSSKNSDLKPFQPLEELVGAYENKGYGELQIKLIDQALLLHFNIYDIPLIHLNFNTFYFDYQGMAVPVRFVSDFSGQITRVEINMEHEMDEPISFSRVKK